MCEDEFKIFWQNHNYNEAVRQLTISYNWLQKYGGSSVPFTETKLSCAYLKIFYGNGADKLHYEDLLKYWLHEHENSIKEVLGMVKDENEYKEILKNQKSLTDIFSGLLSFSFPLAIAGILLLYFFIKK